MNLTSNIYYNSRPTAMDKIIHSARLLSLTKTKKWLHKFIDTGNVTAETGEIVGSFKRKNLLKSFVSVMVDGFTMRYADDWDVHIEKVSSTKYKIDFFTVFSSINITNERGLSHTIKDLIVCIPIHYNSRKESFYPGRIRGGRITLYKKEYQSHYVHSHLRSSVAINMLNEPFYLDEFCIGNGDLSLQQEIMSIDFTIRNLEVFLYELDATVRWESLSGNPYMYIRDIASERKIRATSLGADISETVNNLLQSNIPVNYYISNNIYKIKLDETFNSFVKNCVETELDLQEIKTRVICVFDKTSLTYFCHNSNLELGEDVQLMTYSGEKAYLIYNGQKKIARIRKNPFINVNSGLSTDIPIIYPKFLQNVHTALENKLHENITRYSGISKYYSSQYCPANTTQDSVSL